MIYGEENLADDFILSLFVVSLVDIQILRCSFDKTISEISYNVNNYLLCV